MTAIDDLIERVESGEGADRVVDCLVAQVVLGATHDGQPEPYRKWTLTARDGARVTGSDAVMIRAFTDSLDAVVSLIEQKLPGGEWEATRLGPFCVGRVWEAGFRDHRSIAAEAATPARALLAATLRAIKEQSHD